MKKIVDFFVGQIFIVIVMLCMVGMFYILYSFSNNSQNPVVFYEEVMVDEYQIIIDLNTGMIDKNEILKVNFNDLNTNQTIFKIDSTWQVSLILAIIFTITIDIIYVIFTIFNAIILFILTFKYRKLLKDRCDISDERLYELPMYEAIIANAIYKKRYQYEMIVARLEYYYKINGILDKRNKLRQDIEFDVNSLPELERMLMKRYEISKEKTKKLTRRRIRKRKSKK